MAGMSLQWAQGKISTDWPTLMGNITHTDVDAV